jgi:hypothetical protein
VFNRVQLLPRMKVTIENHSGRLRLRWKDPKQRTLALSLPDTPACRSMDGITKNEIGHYDRILLKYRPRSTDPRDAQLIETISVQKSGQRC